jgi:hypothetical protein
MHHWPTIEENKKQLVKSKNEGPCKEVIKILKLEN